MKWLIDAQLPRRLAVRLKDLGHDAIHTLDLPERNRTSDAEVNRFADQDDRVVVSKDRDFLDSLLITGMPSRLLWVTTGNISNADLLALFESLLPELHNAFLKYDCVELTTSGLMIHQ